MGPSPLLPGADHGKCPSEGDGHWCVGHLLCCTVHFYILPLTLMGELTVNASGSFSREVPVPFGPFPANSPRLTKAGRVKLLSLVT